MAGLYYMLVLLLLLQLSLVCFAAKAADGSPKGGPRDRCRHIVKKETQKYSRRVQALTDRLLVQQTDIDRLKMEQEKDALEMEVIKSNLTEQQKLLKVAVASIDRLQRKIDVVTGETRISEFGFDRTPKSCDDVHLHAGFLGRYEVMIKPSSNSSRFKVLCEQIGNEGWIVIQQRVDGSVDFRRSWEEYKNGFGKFGTEFWLGNDYIHQLTSSGPVTLRVELEEFSGEKRWAEYSHFSIASERNNYAMNISGYSGNAGDDFESRNGQQFSTFDRDNDSKVTDNCAHQYSAGWWYNRCNTSNLNARYLDEETHNNFLYKHGIVWSTIHPHKTLKHTKLLLKSFHRQ